MYGYIVLFLIIIGILGLIGFLKIIKHFNYELKFNESILFSCPILLLIIVFIFDISVIRINIIWELSLIIPSYFLILLIIYHIIRSIKLKKYVPLKSLIGYVLIGITNIVVFFKVPLLENLTGVDGWTALFIIIFYVVFYLGYIILLLLINFIIYIIKLIAKNNNSYKNSEYKISKLCYINALFTILIISLFIFINNYNKKMYNEMLKQEENIVISYLKKEYPKYEFDIEDIYESKTDCSFLVCRTPVIRNTIINKDFNKYFVIDVLKEDLSIYEDEFINILKEEEKNKKENSIKQYLNDNYNVSLSYYMNGNKLENVKFTINREYNKDDIDLFVQDIKDVFNYVDSNFYDIDFVDIYFPNGSPFYDGDEDYYKYNGTITENEMINELWIMINNTYIFVEK